MTSNSSIICLWEMTLATLTDIATCTSLSFDTGKGQRCDFGSVIVLGSQNRSTLHPGLTYLPVLRAPAISVGQSCSSSNVQHVPYDLIWPNVRPAEYSISIDLAYATRPHVHSNSTVDRNLLPASHRQPRTSVHAPLRPSLGSWRHTFYKGYSPTRRGTNVACRDTS
jgi:hypothetical protein